MVDTGVDRVAVAAAARPAAGAVVAVADRSSRGVSLSGSLAGAAACYLCVGQRLVLFSGSHGERCLPLAVMLLILILRRAAPIIYALYGAAQWRARKMALDAC